MHWTKPSQTVAISQKIFFLSETTKDFYSSTLFFFDETVLHFYYCTVWYYYIIHMEEFSQHSGEPIALLRSFKIGRECQKVKLTK